MAVLSLSLPFTKKSHVKAFIYFGIISVCIGLTTACGSEPATKPKKEKKAEVLVEYKDGIYTEYYPGRKAIKFQGPQSEDGIRDGRWFFYSENGTEMSMTEYVKGKKHGFIFVRYPNGAMRYTGEFSNDKESGLWRFYKEDGSLDSEKDYGKVE